MKVRPLTVSRKMSSKKGMISYENFLQKWNHALFLHFRFLKPSFFRHAVKPRTLYGWCPPHIDFRQTWHYFLTPQKQDFLMSAPPQCIRARQSTKESEEICPILKFCAVGLDQTSDNGYNNIVNPIIGVLCSVLPTLRLLETSWLENFLGKMNVHRILLI